MSDIFDKLLLLFRSVSFSCTSEKELQDELANVLLFAGYALTREVELAPGDRIDFLVDTVGVELKVDGATAAVLRQLHRYLQSDKVTSIILVTTKMRHQTLPGELNGKQVAVMHVGAWM